MAKSMIRDRVSLGRRYVRSVDLTRDLADPAALDGYVSTPAARDALSRILAGLAEGSTQRAFRITGPYGSGKSSFALLLARLMAPAPDAKASAVAEAAVPGAIAPTMIPMVLVGRRASLADDLVEAVRTAAAGAGDADVGEAAEALARGRARGRRDVRAVLDLLERHARTTRARSGSGVMLLIDEMGRYLEHAAANRATEDPSIFQLLAERAGGADSRHLAVVGLLHHRFVDYVAGLGDWIEGEWARSAERYEELPFGDSTEQTLFLMAGAMGDGSGHDTAVRRRATELYRQAGDRGVFASREGAAATVASSLYPLHPASIACLAASSRRFGQNDRSVFSFLQSLEPAGFQRFAAQTAYGPKAWYRLDDLFDYMASQGSLRFRSPDRERRWQLALDAVATWAGADALELRCLKCVAVLAALEPVAGLEATADAIGWCVDEPEERTADALAALARASLVHRRAKRGDYSLWSNTSVDLDRWLEQARTAVPAPRRLELAEARLPAARPLVAHRHYHQTGTLRLFAIDHGGTAPAATETDGSVIVVAVAPDDDRDAILANALRRSGEAGAMHLICLRQVSQADLAQAHDVAAWRWVREHCAELRVDELARTEAERRLANAEAAMLVLVTPFARPADGPAGATWIHGGRVVELPDRGALSRLLSDACDAVFFDAPVLRNELINRSRLSTAVAAARTRLLELMLTRADAPQLGLAGAPPERTIFLSLFQESGLHRAGPDGEHAFQPPPAHDPANWRPVWERIGAVLAERGLVRLDELARELAAPPFGLRAGPALPVIAAYMLHGRRDVALMERGTFQPELTSAHFMRLAKNPGNFALRHVGDVGDRDRLLQQLTVGIEVWDPARPRPEPEVKAVVQALYHWWNALPAHAMATTDLDATAITVRAALRKAREPVELIFEALPLACGTLAEGAASTPFVERLNFALLALDQATPQLRRRATASLLDAFAAPDVARLRAQVALDYAGFLLDLSDYRLRAFVDRTAKTELDEETWLDGVANLLVGKRVDAWDDEALDRFSFEARDLAQKLARWLALVRRNRASRVPLTGIHLTAPDGSGRSYYVRDDAAAPGRAAVIERVRAALADHPDTDRILAELLAERLTQTNRETIS